MFIWLTRSTTSTTPTTDQVEDPAESVPAGTSWIVVGGCPSRRSRVGSVVAKSPRRPAEHLAEPLGGAVGEEAVAVGALAGWGSRTHANPRGRDTGEQLLHDAAAELTTGTREDDRGDRR